jgi:hypothetical protein
MELIDKILDISNNAKDKPNKDLFFALNELQDEFEKTKKLIIDLTRHLDNVENMYNKINEEIGKRLQK